MSRISLNSLQQAHNCKSLPRRSSTNTKRAMKSSSTQNLSEKVLKKLKTDTILGIGDTCILPKDKSDNYDAIVSDTLTDDQSICTDAKESIGVEREAPKRKRYGNWLREITNQVCKLLKLRLQSLVCLSRALNVHKNEQEGHLKGYNPNNSCSKNSFLYSSLFSDISDAQTYQKIDFEAFIAFLEGFGKIKRNTYKMTEDYIRTQPLFGKFLTKEILEFIPETTGISDDSQYLRWIESSKRMMESTKHDLLNLKVRSALRNPLQKLYNEFWNCAYPRTMAMNIDSNDACQGGVTIGKQAMSKLLAYKKGLNRFLSLNKVEDEGGGQTRNYMMQNVVEDSGVLVKTDFSQKVKIEVLESGTAGNLLTKEEVDVGKEEKNKNQLGFRMKEASTCPEKSVKSPLESICNDQLGYFNLFNNPYSKPCVNKLQGVKLIFQGSLMSSNETSANKNFLVDENFKQFLLENLKDL